MVEEGWAGGGGRSDVGGSDKLIAVAEPGGPGKAKAWMPTALGFDGIEKGGCAVVGEDGSAARLS